jgi:transposase InsO family protein
LSSTLIAARFTSGTIDIKKGALAHWLIDTALGKAACGSALEHPEKSPREPAWLITDTRGYYISESTVYRILKANDPVTGPIYTVVTAQDKFPHPTRAPNELWQTDFTRFKVVHWGCYYLCTILDDYSRYILAWQLCTGMSTEKVKCNA